ncbi:tetratricopeptide repeat protein [Paraflavitalea sp. CAU 1676]|uniref:tetratricopeptide repeat protein n=1 Tax=Paraflavitalea sp. CAU 1676 TaxID=3032598 RepID=UPI0023DC7BD1|nr:tetratricopeptide repeat protein [Paraflavitalea sp. CAU 1676]MDF2187991.1 tetratricopeptide repeat protein [Paraflavitalea sp. CAU 1676]
MFRKFTRLSQVLFICWPLSVAAQDSTTISPTIAQSDSTTIIFKQPSALCCDSIIAFINQLSLQVNEQALTGRTHTQVHQLPCFDIFAQAHHLAAGELRNQISSWAQSDTVKADGNALLQGARLYYLRQLRSSSLHYERAAEQQEGMLPGKLNSADYHDATISEAIESASTTYLLAANSANENGDRTHAIRLYKKADSLLSFGPADNLPPAMAHKKYFISELLATALYAEGRHMEGADGYVMLAQALQLEQQLLVRYNRQLHPKEWARTKANLGTILEAQGELVEAADSLYQSAHAAFIEATIIYTRAEHPQDWARMQNNTGVVLSKLGRIEEAITAFREALDIYNPKEYAIDWALTQYNLGNMLQFQAAEKQGTDGLQLFRQSIAAYQLSLTVFNAKDNPDEWGWVQHKMGVSLFQQGRRLDGRAMLSDAVSAFRSALTVRTKEGSPTAWANTQYNLGTALWEENGRAAGGNMQLLEEALKAYELALTVYTKKDYPEQWFNTQNSLGLLYEQQQQWSTAIKHFENIRDVEPMYAAQKVNELRKKAGL